MGCGCNKKKIQSGGEVSTLSVSSGCGYDMSQLTKWKNVLDCAYTNNLLEQANLTEAQYGDFIGKINYTIDHINEDCLFAQELGTILNATHVLVLLGC